MFWDVMRWDLDTRVLPIACLFQGQLMRWKHRNIKGRDPAPLEASANIRQLGRGGPRAALHRAGPPSTQLLASREREERGGWQCMPGSVHPKTARSSKNKKNKAPNWTLLLSPTSDWPARSSSPLRALGGVGSSRLGSGWGSRSSSQPQG